MDLNNTVSTINLGTCLAENQVSDHKCSLFDKNLRRINNNLQYVNEYYIPKHEIPVENQQKVRENIIVPKDQKEQSIHFHNEFYKIKMDEIEFIRKTHVKQILSQKANIWEQKRREFMKNVPKNIIKESGGLLIETQNIEKNHNIELQNTNSDQYKTTLLEEQKKSEQKARSIQFLSLLKTGCDLLNIMHNYKNDMIPQFLDNYTTIENEIHRFKNLSENCNTYDLLKLNKTVQIIKMLHIEFMEFLSKAENNTLPTTNVTSVAENNTLLPITNVTSVAENNSLLPTTNVTSVAENNTLLPTNSCVSIAENDALLTTSDDNNQKNTAISNFTFKINANKSNKNLKNNDLNINQESNEIKNNGSNNFPLKEKESDELHTFKFKTNENISNTDISNFCFKIKNNKQEATTTNTSYNFEREYEKYLVNHFAIQKYLTNYTNLYLPFLHDDNQKTLKQELTKAINTPINSISSVSSWHMKDKFEKLNALLMCKTVKTGNSSVSANSHQCALAFCKDTLAKKIINIGEQVVSVKTETAFEVASIVTELWQVHQDFGMLLYARFKQKCPCLIPLNAAKVNNETDEEYYKSLGYNYTDGVVEQQDKYVKRMTGIIRLFAAIIVTETKSGKALGIGQAWMIIATTLHLVPQLDITAVLLHEMLLITGYHLGKVYGNQFIKMLQYINSDYMKKIDEITPIGCGGPVQRLKTFVSKAIEVSYIDKPKSILPYNFW
ncbi:GLE1-like [Cinara cedri]|uniref:mRNA export factor GLE1 n=1 Tax=Cinara cedri TaxID=506608 RepID=A0A5E4NKE4_9HEMI|nr:GLE1-like [Cinara cedri]